MYFFGNELGFERFDESDCFKCILRQICYPKRFLNVSNFFRKTHLFSFKTTDFERFEKFYLSVAFCSISATFCKFLNFKVFFFKQTSFLFKKLNFWLLWEILLFQSYSTTYLPILTISQNSISFVRKPVQFLEKPSTERFKKSYFFSWFCSKFAIVIYSK